MERTMTVGRQIGANGMGAAIFARIAYQDVEAREVLKHYGFQWLPGDKVWRGFAYNATRLAPIARKLLCLGFKIFASGNPTSAVSETARYLHAMGIDLASTPIYQIGMSGQPEPIDVEWQQQLVAQFAQ